MDRTTFCKMLAIAKERSGKTTSDICFDMRSLITSVRRIEHGETNFQMDRCLKYLSTIGYHIVASDNEADYAIVTEADLAKFIKDSLSGRSRSKISIELGCNRSYLRLIENGTHIIAIDKFLKFCEVVGCDLTLNANEQ